MNHLLNLCLFGGVAFVHYFLLSVSFYLILLVFGVQLAVYIVYRLNTRISEIELKMLADSLELKASLKKQVVGAVDFHMRAERKTKPFVKKKTRS
jgi:hypothetical protein